MLDVREEGGERVVEIIDASAALARVRVHEAVKRGRQGVRHVDSLSWRPPLHASHEEVGHLAQRHHISAIRPTPVDVPLAHSNFPIFPEQRVLVGRVVCSLPDEPQVAKGDAQTL
jgi:hypothetical protein